ncbi:hypothetical protein [Photorhabdus sp. RW14-46]|nr:hypothetical protein [Photorhabdus sp. RW14-46]
MTGVRECSQQRSNLKDDGYIPIVLSLWGFVCYIDFCCGEVISIYNRYR